MEHCLTAVDSPPCGREFLPIAQCIASFQKMLKRAPDIIKKEVFPMNNKYEAPVAEVIDFENDYVLAALTSQDKLVSPPAP